MTTLPGSRPDGVSVGEAHRLMADGARLLDVREVDEHRQLHVNGCVHVPLGQLSAKVDELPVGELLVICKSGRRSAVAVELLSASGRAARNVEGGIDAWTAEGLPLLVGHRAARR